jgi:hypothetical protein
MAKVNVGLRVEQEMVDDLEALARLMSVRSGGANVPYTEAARAALSRGIAILREELSGDPPQPKEKKSPARKPAK